MIRETFGRESSTNMNDCPLELPFESHIGGIVC